MGITNNFFPIGFKAHSKRGNPCLAPLSSKETIHRQKKKTNSRKPSTIIMLSKQHIKPTLNNFYIHTLVHPSMLIRETSVCGR